MKKTATIARSTRHPPSVALVALTGLVVVFGFIIVHDILISDIWFNAGPMLSAGALCGMCVAWSYRMTVDEHLPAAWFRYLSLYATEMIVLGAVSLIVLEPPFTMAELEVADDAFDRLLPHQCPC